MQRKTTRYRWLPAFIAGMALIGGQLVNEAAAPARVNAGARQEPTEAKPEAATIRDDRSALPKTLRIAPDSGRERIERPSRKRGKGHSKHKKPKKHKHKGDDDDGDD